MFWCFCLGCVCVVCLLTRGYNNKTGVYKLNFSDCDHFYIGQTGRSFSSRFSEHLTALSNNYIHSAFATHIQTENHSYTNIENNLEILHYLPKSRKLNTAEQYEIYKHHTLQPNNILNDQLHFKSHVLFDTIIHKPNYTLNPSANPLPPNPPHTSHQPVNKPLQLFTTFCIQTSLRKVYTTPKRSRTIRNVSFHK